MMTTIPIASDSFFVWAGYYWGQWHTPFTGFLIGVVAGFIWLLYRLFKENPVYLANEALCILSELGLKTQNPDMGEAQFQKSAVDSMLTNLLNERSQKDGLPASATCLGDGLPCIAPSDLNRMSSDHEESTSNSHSVEQCISISGEKLP